jgi:hypothetical protein
MKGITSDDQDTLRSHGKKPATIDPASIDPIERLHQRYPEFFNASLVEANLIALTQIDSVTKEPILKEIPKSRFENMSLAMAAPIKNVTMLDPLFCNAYHKTGTEICKEFFDARQEVTGMPWRDCAGSSNGGWRQIADHCSKEAGVVNFFKPQIQLDLNTYTGKPYRMLNWIRKPLHIITSALRYHMQSPETWEYYPGRCMGCTEANRKLMFAVCDDNCNYVQLLNSVAAVNKTAGVIIEAMNEHHNLVKMLNFTLDHFKNDQVLHLSVDHFRKDYNQTMRCINAFLGGQGIKDDQLHAFDKLNPASEKFDNKHKTHGKYDNTFLVKFLKSLPVWGPELIAMEEFITQLFQRQAVFGCPVP